MSRDLGTGDASPTPANRRVIPGPRRLNRVGALRWVAGAHGHGPVRRSVPLPTDQGAARVASKSRLCRLLCGSSPDFDATLTWFAAALASSRPPVENSSPLFEPQGGLQGANKNGGCSPDFSGGRSVYDFA